MMDIGRKKMNPLMDLNLCLIGNKNCHMGKDTKCYHQNILHREGETGILLGTKEIVFMTVVQKKLKEEVIEVDDPHINSKITARKMGGGFTIETEVIITIAAPKIQGEGTMETKVNIAVLMLQGEVVIVTEVNITNQKIDILIGRNFWTLNMMQMKC
jgi:hypothetical protein